MTQIEAQWLTVWMLACSLVVAGLADLWFAWRTDPKRP